jgi:hypothetical protein
MNMDSGFPPFFTIILVIIIIVVLYAVIKGISQWSWNNKQPRLAVPATIVSKRQEYSTHTHHNDNSSFNHTTHSTTYYYVTFQFSTGDRIELSVNGNEYGLMAERDNGTLTFQGTRFISFVRI